MNAQTQSLILPGPAGAIEALLDLPEADASPQPVLAIICHPLPTEGGSMHNNHSTSNCHIAARAAGRCKSIRLGHKNEKSNQRRLGSEGKSAGQPAIAGTGSRAR